MDDESDGELAWIVLEQVVEGITVPSQLLLVANAESLVGTSDDPFGSGLFDHDPLDSRRGDH